MKNKSYIGIALVVLLFGIWAVPKIVDRISGKHVIQSDRLDQAVSAGKPDAKLLVLKEAPEFKLTDQHGKPFGSDLLKGQVYVLEFFFTSCPTICPKMNQNMRIIEQKFFGNPNFAIVSITIDPATDTPAVLKAHAQELGVKSGNWHFLTGDKTYIYDVANNGFNVYAGENSQTEGNFEHSGFFALIDKKGDIRCRKDENGNPIAYYDGLEARGIEALMQDIAILLKE